MSPRQSPPPRSAAHRHRRRPGPEDGASAPHPSYPWQWRAGAAHQNHPAAGSAWRTSFVRHLESDSRRYGNPQRVTLSETWYYTTTFAGPSELAGLALLRAPTGAETAPAEHTLRGDWRVDLDWLLQSLPGPQLRVPA